MDKANFDIANYTGHKAFEQLKLCSDLYNEPLEGIFHKHGISINSFDFKLNSDFGNSFKKLSLNKIDFQNLNYIDAFHVATLLSQMNKLETELCINSCIFFQIMLESTINDVANNPRDYFETKWINFLENNNATTEDLQNFNDYLNNIYRGIRNKVVHPNNSRGLRNVEKYNFVYVYENLKKGWYVFVFLLNKIHNFNMNYQDNWTIMCNSHGLPEKINSNNFVNIEKTMFNLFKLHTDHLNKNL